MRDTFTYLFTDVEGSTGQWERLGDVMHGAIDSHDAMLRAAVERNGGVLATNSGDGITAKFTDSVAVVRAAVEAQQTISSIRLPADEPLLVRMAIHRGPVIESGGRDFGPTLNRAARLLAAAHGGQIVLSDDSRRDLVRLGFDDCEMVELGWHHLRDVPEPVLVHQVVVPGLRREFPPLRTIDGHQHNLPQPNSSFVGRRRTVEAVGRRLDEHRLVTITGTGGIGKSRLAIEVGAERIRRYADGVWLVELADVDDRAVVGAVARSLGIREVPGRSLVSTILDRIRDQQMLLILDNCEHVLDGARRVITEVLERASGVGVLATSRRRLGVSGEALWQLEPLGTEQPPTAGRVAQNDSVSLFLERARLAGGEVPASTTDLAAIERLCEALDGLPLAIELAAARARVLSPAQIAARLERRFDLLIERSGTVLRHQTLKSTIDWSYELLSDEERDLCDQLAAFRGIFNLGAVASVTGVDELTVLEPLSRLVDQSLVQAVRTPGEVRYRMLETMRAYGLANLEHAGRLTEVRDRHRRWVLELVDRPASDHLEAVGPAWHNELDACLPNISFAIETGLSDGRPEESLRLCGQLWLYFWLRGHLSDGRSWCERALAAGPDADPGLRAPAVLGAGLLAFAQLDPAAAAETLEEALMLAEATSQHDLAAWAHMFLAVLHASQADRTAAAEHLERALALVSTSVSDGTRAGALYWASSTSSMLGRDEDAARYLEESISLARALPAPYTLTRFLPVLAKRQLAEGDERGALATYEEAVSAARETADRAGLARALTFLAELETARGSYGSAKLALDEALPIVSREIDDRVFACKVELAFAELDRHQGRYESAQAHLERGLEVGGRLTDWKSSTDPFRALAHLHFDRGQSAEALRLIRQSEERARDAGHPERLARALLLHVEYAAASGGRAEDALEEAVDACRTVNSPQLDAAVAHVRGVIAVAANRFDEATAPLWRALQARVDLGHRLSAVETAERLAEAAAGLQRWTVAQRLLAASAHERRRLGAPSPEWRQPVLQSLRALAAEEHAEAMVDQDQDLPTLVRELEDRVAAWPVPWLAADRHPSDDSGTRSGGARRPERQP